MGSKFIKLKQGGKVLQEKEIEDKRMAIWNLIAAI